MKRTGTRRTGGIAALCLLMVMVGAIATSCVGRISLELYLERLDEIRAKSDKASAAVQDNIESVQSGPDALLRLREQLLTAKEVVKQSAEEIGKLKTPREALKLEEIVLELHREAEGFFSDVDSMLVYSAGREPLVAKVETASKDLDSQISSDPSPGASAAALAGARSGVDEAAAGLRRLKPPSFLSGLHRALVGMLERYSASLASLQNAVQSGNPAAINGAQESIRTSLSGNLAQETGKALDAYNARIDRVDKLREEANREETRITTEK